MQGNIVKQPICNNEGRDVFAYEILYVEGNEPKKKPGDHGAASAIESLLMQFDSDRLLEGKEAFVTFTPNLLFRNVPHIFDMKTLVIQFEDDVLLYPLALKMVEKFRKQGYTTALKGFFFNSRYLAALDQADIVKLNLSKDRESLASIVDVVRGLGKEIIAYNVDDEASYERAQSLGIHQMQGLFIGTMLPEKMRKSQRLQGNFFQLMVAITREDPSIDEIEEIISRDVTLTYALIKLVNSAYFALRRKVQSVHQALVVLGLAQLKEWIYLLSFQPDDGLPSEFIKTSFMRALFCSELLPFAQEMPISRSEAYLMGMFSTLSSLLDVSLDVALAELNVSDEIVNALTEANPEKRGRAGILFDLVLSYEKADWPRMFNSAELLGIPVNDISPKYFECMESVNETWNSLTKLTPAAEAEEQ